MTSRNIIKINVGGKIFRTKKSTLIKYDGLLKTLMETSVPVAKDGLECISVDRDPKHFNLILNFIRHGTSKLPGSPSILKEVYEEADFYLLFELMEMCEMKIQKSTASVSHNGILAAVYRFFAPYVSVLKYWKENIMKEYAQVQEDIERLFNR